METFLPLFSSRQTQGQLKLNLAENINANRSSFCQYINKKRRNTENVGPAAEQSKQLNGNSQKIMLKYSRLSLPCSSLAGFPDLCD